MHHAHNLPRPPFQYKIQSIEARAIESLDFGVGVSRHLNLQVYMQCMHLRDPAEHGVAVNIRVTL
jgi:hypothetical protein